jgi:uncharacterized OB-fold protein
VGRQIPLVEYLVIDDGAPYLVARECQSCGALYLDRRNACGHCGKTSFGARRLSDRGTIRSFTIVHRAAPGIPTPYVSAVVDLDGGGIVKSNIVDAAPDPVQVRLRMPVHLTTYVASTDDEATEAVAFGFAPDEGTPARVGSTAETAPPASVEGEEH